MTEKQIIKLKPTEDLNEKIIKEKGNTKCIFYSDDICRNGDKTRDCVNCARVEYHSLYSLNWDNQERLGKIIKQKEQECEEYERILAEIKPVLELYANSKIGEEQLDSTYKITIKESKVLGDTYITFDPRPAKQALQKISEVENEN